jgi:hypothetical protein
MTAPFTPEDATPPSVPETCSFVRVQQHIYEEIRRKELAHADLVKALQAAHALISELRPHHPVLLETGDALAKATGAA